MKHRKSAALKGNGIGKINEGKYPSAILLYPICQADYARVMEIRDKLYDRINIAMSFSGVILLVILQDFDWRIFLELNNQENCFLVFVHGLCSFISVVGIIWAEVELLMLIRGQEIVMLDSIAIRNQKLYEELPEDAALWLIDKYTKATLKARNINDLTQKRFNVAILKIVVSFLIYAILVILGSLQ